MEKEEDKKVKVGKELEAVVEEHNNNSNSNNSEIDLLQFSRKLSITASCDADEDDDVVVLGTSGPVALRDFPHPRPLCANFPFGSTPHKNYCTQCYCVLCEVLAPCSNWEGSDAHCNITKKIRENNETATDPMEKKSILTIEE